MKEEKLFSEKVKSIEINPQKSITRIVEDMANTGFQGRKLAEACRLFHRMLTQEDVTIIMGYSASLSVAGQWKIICWLLKNHYIDMLIPTGANISEDIVEAMGRCYYKGSENSDDVTLFQRGVNRYYDIFGKESDYLEMTELIADYILTLDSDYNYTSREFLYHFGLWLNEKGIKSIVTEAALNKIPIFCPAIADSPYGDAALIAKSKGFNLKIDAIKDYTEFMSLANHITKSGVFYIGGGVPKDFIQLFAVTADLMYDKKVIPNRNNALHREGTDENYYPHEYAIQITTDSPQWGGLSGCSFNEAISWGKESKTKSFVQCFCDATIALPIMMHFISEKKINPRTGTDFYSLWQ